MEYVDLKRDEFVLEGVYTLRNERLRSTAEQQSSVFMNFGLYSKRMETDRTPFPIFTREILWNIC